MQLKATVGSTQKEVARGEVTKGGVQKRMTRVEAWDGSAWKVVKVFVPPMSVNITPNNAFGERTTVGAVTSNPVTATPTGGTGPYTYSWTYVSGDPVSITSPTLATTTFRNPVSATATYQCTVTDKNGLTASDTVGVSLINYASGN